MREKARTAVRFLDLSDSHRELMPELLIKFEEVIEAGCFINGPQVADFERAFADYCGHRVAASASAAGSMRCASA